MGIPKSSVTIRRNHRQLSRKETTFPEGFFRHQHTHTHTHTHTTYHHLRYEPLRYWNLIESSLNLHLRPLDYLLTSYTIIYTIQHSNPPNPIQAIHYSTTSWLLSKFLEYNIGFPRFGSYVLSLSLITHAKQSKESHNSLVG